MELTPTSPRGIALDTPLVAVVEYKPTADDRRRLCIHRGDEANFTLVEQSVTDGQWRTTSREQLDQLSIRQIDADAGLATQESVEG